jgi:hypothetical protein
VLRPFTDVDRDPFVGMVHDPEGDFDHPRLPVGSPLRRHVHVPGGRIGARVTERP